MIIKQIMGILGAKNSHKSYLWNAATGHKNKLIAAKCNHVIWGKVPQAELWNRVISIFGEVHCILERSLSNQSLSEDYLLLSNLASSLGLHSRIKASNRLQILRVTEKLITFVLNLCIVES